MKSLKLLGFNGLSALFALLFFCPAHAGASNLTVCGVADNSAGDGNSALGVVSTTCVFGSTGSFTGTVTESADSEDYWIFISGNFYGSGYSSSFVTGHFSISPGSGDLYPFIEGYPTSGGQLRGPSGDLSSNGDYFTIGASSTNLTPTGHGSPVATVYPLFMNSSLPQDLTSSLGNLLDGDFTANGNLTIGVDYFANPGDYYSFPNGSLVVLASTSLIHVIPEPSTLLLFGSVSAGFLLLRRKALRWI
jgi:hypothetical protein